MSFKKSLEKAVKTKDVKFIESILDPQISFAFEENGSGKKNFLENWELNKGKDPKISKFWDEFQRAISFVYSYEEPEQRFTSPYLFNNYPEAVETYSMSLIAGNVVNIRTKPSMTAPIITQLSWEFAKNLYDEGQASNIKNPGEPCAWQKVCLHDGSEGNI